MKRLLTTLIFAIVSITLLAQTGTGWQQERKKQNFKDSVQFQKRVYFFENGDTVAPYIPVSGYDDLYDYVVQLYPDTALVTTTEFRPNLTHLNTYIRCNKTTQIKVFLPPDSTVNFPIGSTLNFKMDNTGIVTFYESNSVIEAELDSTTINNKNGWATAIKRAANKWDLMGSLK